jgi:hypothetical protein
MDTIQQCLRVNANSLLRHYFIFQFNKGRITIRNAGFKINKDNKSINYNTQMRFPLKKP